MDWTFLVDKFRPTDEKIINYFLEGKMKGLDFPIHEAINEVNICEFEPWELPEKSALPDDEEWYFFWSPHSRGGRFDRITAGGYWKVNGKDRPILDNSGEELIGLRKALVYFKGRRSNAVKTNWIIHEFHSDNAYAYEKQFVLCRLKRKSDDKFENYTQGESSSFAAF